MDYLLKLSGAYVRVYLRQSAGERPIAFAEGYLAMITERSLLLSATRAGGTDDPRGRVFIPRENVAFVIERAPEEPDASEE